MFEAIVEMSSPGEFRNMFEYTLLKLRSILCEISFCKFFQRLLDDIR